MARSMMVWIPCFVLSLAVQPAAAIPPDFQTEQAMPQGAAAPMSEGQPVQTGPVSGAPTAAQLGAAQTYAAGSTGGRDNPVRVAENANGVRFTFSGNAGQLTPAMVADLRAAYVPLADAGNARAAALINIIGREGPVSNPSAGVVFDFNPPSAGGGTGTRSVSAAAGPDIVTNANGSQTQLFFAQTIGVPQAQAAAPQAGNPQGPSSGGNPYSGNPYAQGNNPYAYPPATSGGNGGYPGNPYAQGNNPYAYPPAASGGTGGYPANPYAQGNNPYAAPPATSGSAPQSLPGVFNAVPATIRGPMLAAQTPFVMQSPAAVIPRFQQIQAAAQAYVASLPAGPQQEAAQSHLTLASAAISRAQNVPPSIQAQGPQAVRTYQQDNLRAAFNQFNQIR
ncbi:MAG: hypothetical protein JO102_01265 [Elusimicrobia bacterium]|nr:hypothetical protein [Elusimicrobiota bacterium]